MPATQMEIFNRDEKKIPVTGGGDGDGAGICKLQGVGHEILDDLPDPAGVAQIDATCGAYGRGDGQVLAGGDRLVLSDHYRDQFGQAELDRLQGQFAGLYLGHVQDGNRRFRDIARAVRAGTGYRQLL